MASKETTGEARQGEEGQGEAGQSEERRGGEGRGKEGRVQSEGTHKMASKVRWDEERRG